jgi:membrane fusion protein (multidrug efflux system)
MADPHSQDAAPSKTDGTPDDEAHKGAPRDEAVEDKPSPLKNPLVKAGLLIGAATLLVLVIVWFVNFWTYGRFQQGTNDAYLQTDQVTVATRVAGFVDQVFVADNHTVKAGDPLAKIDERDPRARMDQALAQVAQARASVAEAEAQIRQQQAQISQSRAQLTGAAAQARFADKEAARYAPLAAAGAETQERLDQMRQNRDQANAQLAQSTARVTAAERQIDTLKAQITAADAQIQQAEAQVGQAKVDLDATLIRASIDGRVGDKTVRIGQYVQPGTRLMTVVPIQNIYLVANFKETQLGLMRIGQPATIKVDALKGEVLHGWVESFAPGTGAQFALIPPTNATGNFTKIVQRVPTRIRIDAGPEARKVLVPGMSVTVSVNTLSAKSDAKAFKREDHQDDRKPLQSKPSRRRDDGAGQ